MILLWTLGQNYHTLTTYKFHVRPSANVLQTLLPAPGEPGMTVTYPPSQHLVRM
jgi:hypothetical protein